MFFKAQEVKKSIYQLPTEYSALNATGRYQVRYEYEIQQKGLCYYCHGDLRSLVPEDILKKKVTPKLYPEGFFDHPIHLHHDHNTDMTIGAVHAYCNAILWEYHNE